MKENNVVACIDRLRSLEASGKLSDNDREEVEAARVELETALEVARASGRMDRWRPIVKAVGQIALWLLLKHFDAHDENP